MISNTKNGNMSANNWQNLIRIIPEHVCSPEFLFVQL